MPTYVYKFVKTGETIEVQQSFQDDSLTEIAHPDSGDVLAVKKVFQPVGVTFKGSGFFKNDNRGQSSSTVPSGSTGESSSGESSSSSSDSGSSSSGSSDSGSSSSTTSDSGKSSSNSKSDSKPGSKNDSSSTKKSTSSSNKSD